MRLIPILALLLGASFTQAQTSISAVYFGQTHVQKATDTYFGLVGNRETLIKAHVVNPNGTTPAPTVTATLTASGLSNLVLTLTGPATLPASIPDGLGVVQHSFANTFTGYIPANYVKTGLRVTVTAGTASTTITNMKVSAPTKVIMTMTDVQYFSNTTSDYAAGIFDELEAKWPVADLEVRRLRNVVFPELVIPPRSDVGAKAARLKSKADYTIQTGLTFDGEQAAALAWNGALKRAAGRSGRWSYYYLNVYNANAGGQAGGFAGVGSGTSEGILQHESGHAMSLPHWGDSGAYPYKGAMHGISAPAIYNATHAGPVWAFDLRTKPGAFIPPTTQPGNAGGKPVDTYKADPMQGGGFGWQEPAYQLNHFSDYSVNQMRNYLNGHVVVWNPALNSGNGSWAQWNSTAGAYTTTVSNNGVQFPTTRDTQVISIMASISGSNPGVTMVYPPIGPYQAGLIRLFDPTVPADRTSAQSIFSPANGSDLCVRVVQGGVTKTYMLAASWLTNQGLTSSGSLVTEAINLPASGGTVTKIQLLLTPDVEDNGLPANPQVLSTWAPLMPDPSAFATPPKAYSPTAISMKATTGEVAFGYTGTVEYLFTETTGRTGGTSSGWQTSPSYTDTGLQANTQYSYRVSMRAGGAGGLTVADSAVASATTLASSAPNNVTVNSTQQFNLVANLKGFQNVTGLGTFNAGTADKLVVVISTEDGSNRGTGYVYGVRYNGKTMTQAIQEHGGQANGSAAIFFLDNPGSIGTGTIQVSAESPNGGIGTAYALSNTMPGVGVTNSRFGATANSVSLATAGERSMVIAVLQNSGNPNTAGTPTATAPLTQTSSGSWGSAWGSHASGYQLVATPAAITPTFSTLTGGSYNINIAAAEFPGKTGTVPVVLPNVWAQNDGGTQNWTTASNWQDSAIPNPTTTTTMDFSAVDILADTTLNLGANRTARVWEFGDILGTENWIVGAGHTLTLGGTTPTIQVDNNTTRIDAIVAGTAGLTKTGAGTLNLQGNNTYTGGTILSAGTLQFAKTAVMPASGTVAVGTGATLAVNIGGTGEWTTDTTGNGTMGGLLAGIGGQGAPVTYTGNTTVGFDTTNAVGIQTYAGAIANTGTTLGLSKLGAGTLTLTAANTYTGPTTISGGTLRFSGAGRLNGGNYAGAVFIAGDATLEYSGSSGQTFSGAITGGGNLKSTTNVDFIMSNKANDFGSFSIGSGRVFINTNAGALPSAAAVNITGGLLAFGSATEVSENPFTVGSGGGIVTRRSGGTTLRNVRLPGTGTVIFNNDDANTGTLNITNDLIVDEYDPVTGDLISTGAQIITGNLTLQVGGTRMTDTTSTLGKVIFGGRITGPGSLTVTSSGKSTNTNLFRSGVLTLTGSNDYAGGTIITTGTLALGDSDVIPDTRLTIANGKLDAGTFTETLGPLAITGSATINLGDGATLSFADSSAISWGSGTLTLTGNFIPGSSIRFGTNATALTPAQLAKIGSAVISSFSLDADGYLIGTPAGGTTFTITNTTTDVNGTCTPTGVASVGSGGSQTYTLTPEAGYAVATLTVNGAPVTPALSYTFNNVTANQTISATFVDIAGALLFWDSDGSLPGFGSTTGTWGNSSFWSVNASGSSAPIAVATDTDSSVNFGSATLNYNNATVAVADGVNAGNLTFGAGQSTPLTLTGGSITLGDTAAITVNNTTNTIASVLTGAGTSLTKAGAGSLILSGGNTYTGDTAISTGTLRLGASNVIPDGTEKGSVAVTSTLDLNTFSETLNGLSGVGTVDTLAGGTPTLTLGGGDATSTFNGTIINTAGTLSLVKIGNGTLTLTGANGYGGLTTISGGTLALSGAGTLGTTASGLTLSGGRLDLGGLSRTQGAVSIAAAANTGDTIRNGTLTGTSFAASNPSGNAIISAALAGSTGFTKSGNGTTTLSGANSYNGTTTINEGTLQLGANNTLPTGTALTLGSGATVGGLDLDTFDQTVASLAVISNSASDNTLTIGPGKTLTITNGAAIGLNVAGNTTTNLTATGLGTLSVTGGNFTVGASSSGGTTHTLDMSGLANFSYTGNNTFSVGVNSNSSVSGSGNSTLILANDSTITAASLVTQSQLVVTNSIRLGSGNNTLSIGTIDIGMTSARASSGNLSFNTTNGALTLRGNSGSTSRAAMNVGFGNASTAGGGGSFNTVDLSGHFSELLLSTLQIAGRTNTVANSGINGSFTFDAGTLNATGVTVARGASNGASTGVVNGTLNLGGGNVTIGTSGLTVANSSGSGSSYTVNGTVNISNGNVGIGNTTTSITLGSSSNATAGATTAALNLTGGTLTVAGSIVKGSTTGTVNSTLKLNGGALNMGGKNIGAAGVGAISFTAESGTLQNVAAINGSGGLTKTTAGTLVLSGTNTYSGPTVISSGVLALGANNAIPATALTLDSATLNAANFTDAVGTLDVTGSAVINLGAAAALTFADSSAIDWTGGTLDITGTFVSGSSLRFGNSATALTATQLALITVPGGGPLELNANGFLVSGYTTWAATNAASSSPAQDQDNDGVSNAVEFVLGGSSIANDLSKLPALTTSGGNINFTFMRSRASINSKTNLAIQVGTNLTTWPSSYNVGINTTDSSAGVTVLQGVPAGFDTITLSIPQAPDLQKFLRLQVTITP
jgi:autotransporter-associated beta strand protein